MLTIFVVAVLAYLIVNAHSPADYVVVLLLALVAFMTR